MEVAGSRNLISCSMILVLTQREPRDLFVAGCKHGPRQIRDDVMQRIQLLVRVQHSNGDTAARPSFVERVGDETYNYQSFRNPENDQLHAPHGMTAKPTRQDHSLLFKSLPIGGASCFLLPGLAPVSAVEFRDAELGEWVKGRNFDCLPAIGSSWNISSTFASIFASDVGRQTHSFLDIPQSLCRGFPMQYPLLQIPQFTRE